TPANAMSPQIGDGIWPGSGGAWPGQTPGLGGGIFSGGPPGGYDTPIPQQPGWMPGPNQPPGLGGGPPPGLLQAMQQLQGNGGQGMPGQSGWPRMGGLPNDTRNVLQQQPMPMIPGLLGRRGPGMMQ